MKAYQVVEYGTPIVPRQVADPVPSGKEVVVDVAACGLCHSDAHFQQGHLSLGGDQRLPLAALGVTLPATFGHEIIGRISTFGPDSGLSKSDIGRSVIVYPWLGCGHCRACLAGRDNECPAPQSIGTQRHGGHGEKVLVREAKFLVDAAGLDPQTAGIFACCGLTAYAALAKVLRREGWLAIIGMGGVGLMGLSIAKGTGFGRVAAVDIDDGKLALAGDLFGADLLINSKSETAIARLKEETADAGLMAVIDFVGSDQTSRLALDILANGGTYVSVGLFGGQVSVPLAVLSARSLTVRGSYVGNPQELRELVGHVRAGRVRPIPLRIEPIEKVNEGIAALRAGQVHGRIVHLHAQSAS
jgi:alcohol dehydrogenase, propanol-preferring